MSEIKKTALHSASCCMFKDELYVAFYAGEKECVNQSVYIYKINDEQEELFYVLPKDTGNPVLFTLGDKLFCAFSYFTREMERSVFELWATTTLAMRDITPTLDTDNGNKKEFILSTNCCPRSNPFYLNESTVILPCYDEHMCAGVYFTIGGNSYVERCVDVSNMGVIQPSVFSYEGKYYSLYRNFTRNPDFSLCSKIRIVEAGRFNSANFLLKPQVIQQSIIPNNNESIATINDKNGNAFIVYNNKIGRKELTLGRLTKEDGVFAPEPLVVLNKATAKASYPNCCYDSDGNMVVVFTAYNDSINIRSTIEIVKLSSEAKVIERTVITPEDLP